MYKNKWIWVLLVIAVLIGIWIIMRHNNDWDGKLSAGCTEEAKLCHDGSSVGRVGPNCEFAECPTQSEFVWDFKELPAEEGGQGPRTEVTVNINGTDYNVGSHVGSCSRIKDTSWQLLENEIDGVICYFAGFGIEIGIFEENGKFMVRKGYIDEGNDIIDGSRGNFELLFGL